MDTGSRSEEVTVEIKGGFRALIDKDDLQKVKDFKWLLHVKSNGYISVYRYKRKGPRKYARIKMHTDIMGAAPHGLMWDHRNGNTLDNRKANFRLATQRQNSQNARVRRIKDRPVKPKSSRYKGVSYSLVHKRDTLTKPWRCRIRVNGQSINIGWFKTEEEAALAYNKNAEYYFGEFCSLNEVK